jgi:hypothetical protein
MRGLALLPILVCAAASAQNWALLNPAYKYNYSNDGSDTISNQIFVTHIDTLGEDSFRYELNRIAVQCDSCLDGTGGVNAWCNGCYLWLDQPQFPQRDAYVSGTTWHMSGPHSIAVLPDKPWGSTWLMDTASSTVATVVGIMDSIFMGISDSLKIISTSAGDTLVLGRNTGIVRWDDPYGAVSWRLIGVHGPDIGHLIPSPAGLMDLAPGDILQYEFCVGAHQGDEYVDTDFGTCKYTITGPAVSDMDGISYPASNVAHGTNVSHIGSSALWEYSATDPICFGPAVHRWSTPFYRLATSYPGQFIGPDTLEPGLWSDGFTCVAQHELGSDGNYVIRSRSFDLSTGTGNLISTLTTSIDNLVAIYPAIYEGSAGIVFGAPYGMQLIDLYDFEGCQDYYLVGTVLSGDTSGVITSDSEILSVAQFDVDQEMFPSPNPANDHLDLSAVRSGETYSILDPIGRVVMSGTVGDGHILISCLTEGSFLIKVGDLRGRRFIIAR